MIDGEGQGSTKRPAPEGTPDREAQARTKVHASEMIPRSLPTELQDPISKVEMSAATIAALRMVVREEITNGMSAMENRITNKMDEQIGKMQQDMEEEKQARFFAGKKTASFGTKGKLEKCPRPRHGGSRQVHCSCWRLRRKNRGGSRRVVARSAGSCRWISWSDYGWQQQSGQVCPISFSGAGNEVRSIPEEEWADPRSRALGVRKPEQIRTQPAESREQVKKVPDWIGKLCPQGCDRQLQNVQGGRSSEWDINAGGQCAWWFDRGMASGRCAISNREGSIHRVHGWDGLRSVGTLAEWQQKVCSKDGWITDRNCNEWLRSCTVEPAHNYRKFSTHSVWITIPWFLH